MASSRYARVSTREQDLTIQREALRAAGCAKIYAEEMSGIRSNRLQLTRFLNALEPGDTVIVTAARSASQIDARPAKHDRQHGPNS
jgi:DNA invertase Pin-like site-specific DNA recombinase